MTITPQRLPEIDRACKTALIHRRNYEEVGSALNIPWDFIAGIHNLECSQSFTKHLHCGDPLTARTVHVPKGRPLAPPANGKVYTWEESAIDALTLKGLHRVSDWSIEAKLYYGEGYNGWGYRWYHPDVLSAYLWSFSNHYRGGKYVADGKWSQTAPSGQIGLAVFMKRLYELTAQPLPQPTTTAVPVTTAAQYANLLK